MSFSIYGKISPPWPPEGVQDIFLGRPYQKQDIDTKKVGFLGLWTDFDNFYMSIYSGWVFMQNLDLTLSALG